MTEAVFTALLTGIFALAGNIVTCILSSRKTQAAIREKAGGDGGKDRGADKRGQRAQQLCA